MVREKVTPVKDGETGLSLEDQDWVYDYYVVAEVRVQTLEV